MKYKLLIMLIISCFFIQVGPFPKRETRSNDRSSLSFSGTASQEQKHDLFILSIGINEYHNYGDRNPLFAEKDAQDFANTLERVAKESFAKIHTTLLVKENATRSAIIHAIVQISAKARSDDTFVFFFSGHGTSINFKTGALFYLVPSDYDGSKHKITDKGISATELRYWLIQVASNHQLVILDSSKSDNGFNQFKDKVETENEQLTGSARRDMVILSVRSQSFEFKSLQQGVLTYVVLRGLNGGASRESGEVSVQRLASYVASQTPPVLKKHANRRARQILKQSPISGTPFVYSSGEDFLLGMAPPKKTGDNKMGMQGDQQLARNDHHMFSGEVPPKQARTSKPAYKPKPQCEVFSTKRPSTSISLRKGKDIALLIAFNDYAHWTPLTSPVFDAQTLADVLHDHFDFETEVLKNPPKICIDDAIQRYQATHEYEPDDQLFVFFSGHGYYNEQINAGFLVIKESLLPEDDPDNNTCVVQCFFRRRLTGIGSPHLLLVVDACFSGLIDDAVDAIASKDEPNQTLPRGNSDEEFLERILGFKTRLFITSGDKEYVPAGNPGEHSPFASQLLLALDQKNEGHSFVTLSDIAPIIKRAPIPPRFGSWEGDRGRGDFVLFFH